MQKDFIVKTNETAEKIGSGLLPVLSTPSLVAMIENTSLLACKDFLTEGESTVGVSMSIEHLLPSAVGDTISVTSTLLKAGKRSFSFEFEVTSKNKRIAKGTHVRVRVNNEEFLANLAQ